MGSRSGFARLTIAQLQYIDAIHQLGEPTITEIAARLSITKASVTTGVNKLVSLGYVVKTPSSVDRRALQVSLTAAGRPDGGRQRSGAAGVRRIHRRGIER